MALITLNVTGRSREFSLRRVLGAGLKDIAANITNQYVTLFAIALTLGAPAGYALIRVLFDSAYAYHIPVDFSGSAFAVAPLLLVLLITISTQVRKIITAGGWTKNGIETTC